MPIFLSFGLTGIAAVGAITAAAGAVASGTAAGINASKNKKAARLESAKQRRMEQRLEQLEQMRQPVINQAAKIREMKDQVFNPYANIGVAMKATELQIAETDKALANTLDAIQAQGPGAGSATALAQMAAAGKAQVSAQIENQEASNMQLRLEGEAAKQNQLMQLEQTALAEEVAAFDRQEERDVAQMSRTAGLADRAGAQAIAYEQAAQQQTMDALGAVTDLGTSMMTMGQLNNTGSGLQKVTPGQGGYGLTTPAGTTTGLNAQGNQMSYAPGYNPNQQSDIRLKKNIKLIGKSKTGLNIYEFEYINKKGLYQGAMSNEVPKEAVVVGDDGYDMVNYDKIDVDFIKIK